MIFFRGSIVLALVLTMMVTQYYAHPYFPRSTSKKCLHTRVRKMMAADCHDLTLDSVPKHLAKDIEVLDVSYNRIRELRNGDFSYYKYVKMLYLNENFVSHVENNTFASLKHLEVLNLSLNNIPWIPQELFHLKHLRKLTLDHNALNENTFEDMCYQPAMISLQFLSMAHCKLEFLPPMDRFPHIEFLNISGNNLGTIRPSEVAPACLLTKIDLSGNEELFKAPGCDCISLKRWTAKKNISVVPSFDLLCLPMAPEAEEACYNQTVVETDALYTSCRASYASLQDETRRAKLWYWVSVTCGLLAAVLIALMCYVCYSGSKIPDESISLEQQQNNGEINRNLIDYNNGYGNDGDD